MKNLLHRFKNPLLFVLALIPFAIAGGYFTGVYSWAELAGDVKARILPQIGGNVNLYYLITTVQTLIYTVVLGFFGYIISGKIALMRPVAFKTKPLLITAGTAVLTGLFLCTDIFFFRYSIPQVAALYQAKPTFAYWVASVLYGGVVEEVMLRLFFMSLIALVLKKLFFKKAEAVPVGVLIAANVLSAVLFAAGHLPATLQTFGALTPLLLVRCFLLNGAGGLAFGYVYRRYGIQYSALAHAGAHVVWKLIWIILL